MNTGYRESSSVCPHCLGEFVPRETRLESVIDVCKDCEGVWIDWFDGDLAALVGERAPSKEAARAPSSPDASVSVRGCPRCRRPLVEEPYLGDGPSVLRCGECAGAFVPRASALELVHYRAEERPNLADAGDGFLGKLVERIRAALGL